MSGMMSETGFDVNSFGNGLRKRLLESSAAMLEIFLRGDVNDRSG